MINFLGSSILETFMVLIWSLMWSRCFTRIRMQGECTWVWGKFGVFVETQRGCGMVENPSRGSCTQGGRACLKTQARDVLAEVGRGDCFYLDSQVIIPVHRSTLRNSLSSSRIWGSTQVSGRGIQGETESHSPAGEKASPEVISNWQTGIQQRALQERQTFFCNYHRWRLF